MQIYNYDGTTGEYLFTSLADMSPLEKGVYLIPANATTVAPPAAQVGYARVFGGSTWAQIRDLRGTKYWLSDGSENIMISLGALPPGASVTAPSAPASVTTLSELQTAQTVLIENSCAAVITSGFASSALGASYKYPSKITDQQNLTANALASLMPGVSSTWTTLQICQDSTGAWAYLPHTAAQIQQVAVDMKAWIQSCIAKKATLEASIAAATTSNQVEAIVWA